MRKNVILTVVFTMFCSFAWGQLFNMDAQNMYSKLMESKQYDRCIEYFDSLIVDAKKNDNITPLSGYYQNITQACIKKKDFVKAHSYVDKGLSEFTQNVYLMIAKSDVYVAEKKYSEAIAIMDKAIIIQPQNETLYYWRAKAKKSGKQYDDAVNDYQKCQDLESHNSRGFEGIKDIASIYKKEKNYDKALQIINKALNIKPKDIDALITKSRIYTAQENHSQAIATMDKAVGLEPKTANCYYWRAEAKESGKQYDAAIADYQNFQDLEPSNSAGYQGMEVIYDFYLGKYDLAKQCFNKAIAIKLAKQSKVDYIILFETSIEMTSTVAKVINQEDIIIELGGKPDGKPKNINTIIETIARVEVYKDIPEKNAKYYKQMESYKKNAAIVKERLGITDSQINACIAYLKYKRSKTKME